ncbi:VOC family protein [Glycomyces buryatensis]|uniref:Glyoxalase/bleomycin resistance/extradiol dioxygenase family protein n=1 Tax=Glycomyces buryatensis TaxID=2570927 RepID=A0A4S8QDS7_9ACTN|nr:VOC family protein [Glycomyces buryatensis]THV38664.1 glyoxalase/bleomycin resistance/extradiol dioxygenase family protein [Glycomyces buryatensis]
MAEKMIFLNLPVADLQRSKEFYEGLGWSINPDFSDENAACVVVDDNICLMLLTRAYYTTFTKRPVADTTAASGAMYALALPDRGSVDDLVTAALKAGGVEEDRPDIQSQQEEVGMYGRNFIDPDGHQWEPFHMPNPQAE